MKDTEHTRILVSFGEVKAIARLLNVTERTVYNALRGLSSSDLACRIRRIAIARGGAKASMPTKTSTPKQTTTYNQ